MYSEHDSAFGMQSPVSLNEMDGSEQFKTFSEGQRRTRAQSSRKKKIPVLTINLKSLLATKGLRATSNDSFTITQDLRRKSAGVKDHGEKSIIRQVKYSNKLAREPFAEKNAQNTKFTSKTIESAYKYISPYKRKLSICLERAN